MIQICNSYSHRISEQIVCRFELCSVLSRHRFHVRVFVMDYVVVVIGFDALDVLEPYFDGTLETAMYILDAYKARLGEWYAVDIELSDLRVLPDDFWLFAERFDMEELSKRFQWGG